MTACDHPLDGHTAHGPWCEHAEDHEVSAYYDNLRITRNGGNSPTVDCSCGRSFSADTWEEAGTQMDEHLEDVRSEEAPGD